MTKRPDVYTTLGPECGCCGHRHATVEAAAAAWRPTAAGRSRTAAWSPVVADAPWPPAAGRDLNGKLAPEAGPASGASSFVLER